MTIELSLKSVKDDQRVRPTTLHTVINAIRNGLVAQQIYDLRQATANGDSEEAKEIKLSLPCFYCTRYADEYGGASKYQQSTHTGIMVFDVDKISIETANQYKQCVIDSALKPYITAVFISPSGGLKILIKTTYDEYHDNTEDAHDFYKYAYGKLCELLIKTGIDGEKADAQTNNFNRTTFISHDPDLFYEPDAKRLPITRFYDQWRKETEKERQRLAEQLEKDRVFRQHAQYDESLARSDVDLYLHNTTAAMRSGNRHDLTFKIVAYVYNVGLSEHDAANYLYTLKHQGHYTETQSPERFARDAWRSLSRKPRPLNTQYYKFDINDRLGRKNALTALFATIK
ncbi:MAG: BT4734/BF3469 family protein [Plesiomonas shigelloides]